MQILYYSVHPNLSLQDPAGYATHMREMIVAFEGLGHTVHSLIAGDFNRRPPSDGMRRSVAGNSYFNGLKKSVKAFMPSYLWRGARDLSFWWHDRKMAQQLRDAIERYEPDLIYERVWYLSVSGVRVAEETKIPIITEVNSPYVLENVSLLGSTPLVGWARRCEKEVLTKATKIIVVSSPLKEYFVETYGSSLSNICVLPNAVNLSDFDPTLSGEQMRQKYEIPDDAIVLGFVGSFFRWHGIGWLIEAVSNLRNHPAKIHALIVGDGEIRNELEQLAESRDVINRIIFTGSVPKKQVSKMLAAMDVCVMPGTNWYGSPVKIFEYAAMKKPIIAPDKGPVRDVMIDGEDGILVDSTTEALTEAILRMIEDRTFGFHCGESFHEKIKTRHTWHANAERVLALLNNSVTTV